MNNEKSIEWINNGPLLQVRVRPIIAHLLPAGWWGDSDTDLSLRQYISNSYVSFREIIKRCRGQKYFDHFNAIEEKADQYARAYYSLSIGGLGPCNRHGWELILSMSSDHEIIDILFGWECCFGSNTFSAKEVLDCKVSEISNVLEVSEDGKVRSKKKV